MYLQQAGKCSKLQGRWKAPARRSIASSPSLIAWKALAKTSNVPASHSKAFLRRQIWGCEAVCSGDACVACSEPHHRPNATCCEKGIAEMRSTRKIEIQHLRTSR